MAMRVRNFGGLSPKDSPRVLAADKAQTANNLQANTIEFRPSADDTTVVADSGVSNPLTIFRLQRTSGGALNTNVASAANWKTYAADVNLVKWPIDDDATDRHSLSYNDGSTAPRLIDATGTDRQLGVPKPTVAPVVVVNVTDEFTVEERGLAITALGQAVLDIIRANATETFLGPTHPGNSTSGYVDYQSSALTNSSTPVLVRAYRLTGAGGTVNNSYSSVAAEDFSWIFDPSLGPVQVQAPSGLTWCSVGQYHLCLLLPVYGRGYTLDTTTIRTQLLALIKPGTTSDPAFTSGQVDNLIAQLQAFDDPVDAMVTQLDAAVDKLKALLDGGARASLAATTQAFYSKSDVAQAITDAIANTAQAIWSAADSIARSTTPAAAYAAGGFNPDIAGGIP